MNKRHKTMRRLFHFFLLILLKLFVPMGCVHAADASTKSGGPLGNLVQPDQDFDFSTEKDVWVEVRVNDLEGVPADRRTVEILEPVAGEDGGFRVIERGLTDDSGSFDRKIRIPGSVRNLLIRVGVAGIDNSALVPVDSSLTLHRDFG